MKKCFSEKCKSCLNFFRLSRPSNRLSVRVKGTGRSIPSDRAVCSWYPPHSVTVLTRLPLSHACPLDHIIGQVRFLSVQKTRLVFEPTRRHFVQAVNVRTKILRIKFFRSMWLRKTGLQSYGTMHFGRQGNRPTLYSGRRGDQAAVIKLELRDCCVLWFPVTRAFVPVWRTVRISRCFQACPNARQKHLTKALIRSLSRPIRHGCLATAWRFDWNSIRLVNSAFLFFH